MVVGMGRFTGLGEDCGERARSFTTEDTGDAEDFDFFWLVFCPGGGATAFAAAEVFCLFSSKSFAYSAVFSAFFFGSLSSALFLSIFATASANHAAFNFPPPAGARLPRLPPAAPRLSHL